MRLVVKQSEIKWRPMCKLDLINNNMSIIMQLDEICNGQKISTIKRYRDIYLCVDAYVKQGAKKSEAITWTSDDFRIGEASVYRALGWFD